MELPKNAIRYLYMLEAGALDPGERERLSASWTPEERHRVAEECREKARLYSEEAELLGTREPA